MMRKCRAFATWKGENGELLSKLKGILVGDVEKKRVGSDPLLIRLKRILSGHDHDEKRAAVSQTGNVERHDDDLAPHASMVRVLCQAGKFDEAYRGALAMLRQGLALDTVVLNTLLYGLNKCGLTDQSAGLLREMTAKGYSPPPERHFDTLLEQGPIFYASLVPGLLKVGKVDEAYSVFRASETAKSDHSAATCDSLLQRLADLGRGEQACHVALFMLRKEMTVESKTFNSLAGKLCKGGYHELVVQACYRNNFTTFDNRIVLAELNSLGKVDEATQFFVDMAQVDGKGCQACLELVCEAIIRKGEHQLLERIIRKTRWITSTCTYNILIRALFKANMEEAAFGLVQEMKAKGCEPDHKTQEAVKLLKQKKSGVEEQTTLLRELLHENKLEDALQLYSKLAKRTCLKLDIDSYNAMLRQLWASERETEALRMFQQISRSGLVPNTTTFDILITGLSRSNKPEAAFKVMQQMPGLGCVPGYSTFKPLLTAACQADDYRLVKNIVSSMQVHRLQPDYKDVVLCYSRLGQLVDMQELIIQVIQSGSEPTNEVFQLVVSKLCETKRLECAWNVIEEARKAGMHLEEAVYQQYVVALLKSGELELAKNRFRDMDSGSFLTCLVEAGLVTEGRSHFRKMVEDGNDSWSVMLTMICSGKVGAGAACKLLDDDDDDAASTTRLATELLKLEKLDAAAELLIQWSDEKIKHKAYALYDRVIMDMCKLEKYEEAALVLEQLFAKGVLATSRAGKLSKF